MESLTDDEKRQLEINKMFDISEKIVMEYICKLLEKKPNEIFKDSEVLNLSKEDLILFPSTEYDSNKYLSLGLEIVSHDHITVIPEQLKNNTYITESINFIAHSVYEVFRSIINYNLTEEGTKIAFEKSIHFELDEKS